MKKSSGDAPYLPWYPKDFLASTRGWSLASQGAYRALLDAQWTDGALAADPKELRAMIHAKAAEWAPIWRRIEAKFPISESDGLRRNWRLDAMRMKILHAIAAKIAGGRRGGKARKSKRKSGSKKHTHKLRSSIASRYAATHKINNSDTDINIRAAAKLGPSSQRSLSLLSDVSVARGRAQRSERPLETAGERRQSRSAGEALPGFSNLLRKLQG